jgi:hypothetical protein
MVLISRRMGDNRGSSLGASTVHQINLMGSIRRKIARYQQRLTSYRGREGGGQLVVTGARRRSSPSRLA